MNELLAEELKAIHYNGCSLETPKLPAVCGTLKDIYTFIPTNKLPTSLHSRRRTYFKLLHPAYAHQHKFPTNKKIIESR